MPPPAPPEFPEALTWPERARALTITDQASYDTAAGMKKTLADFRKRIVEEFAPLKQAAHNAHRLLTSKEASCLAPITEAEQILVGAINRFTDEQERLRREEQARLDAQRREAERIERERAEAEHRALLAKQAEERQREEEQRLAAAVQAEELGASADVVESVMAAPLRHVEEAPPVEALMRPVEAPVVAAPTFQRQTGLGIRETWKAEVKDIKALCRAVADGRVPDTYVTANMTALNSRARSDKQAMQVPGVVAVRG